MTCPACDGGWRPKNGRMIRCDVCAEPDFRCRGVSCLDVWRCNVAGACSLPEPEPQPRRVTLRVGESVCIEPPPSEAGYRLEQDGVRIRVWRVR